MKKIVECVPNFSEGRDQKKIDQIVQEIKKTKSIKLLDVAPDKDLNRTVITFVGKPKAVKKAAFNAIAKSAELIDMSLHKGEHPRVGACDVCPFIPISGITMKECVVLANELGKEVGKNLGIPVYLYEEAAKRPERRNLATIRAGEYEGLEEKMKDPQWKPDYGEARLNRKSGATVIGARMFLIAFNVNLDTSNVSIAKKLSGEIRESGVLKTQEDGSKIRIPGAFKLVKAIGVAPTVPEGDEPRQGQGVQGITQVSMNFTNYKVTGMHTVYEKIKELAGKSGTRVLGSEIVGVVLKEALLDSGRFYAPEEKDEQRLIKVAIKNLGLDKLEKFFPEKKIIEYLIEEVK